MNYLCFYCCDHQHQVSWFCSLMSVALLFNPWSSLFDAQGIVYFAQCMYVPCMSSTIKTSCCCFQVQREGTAVLATFSQFQYRLACNLLSGFHELCFVSMFNVLRLKNDQLCGCCCGAKVHLLSIHRLNQCAKRCKHFPAVCKSE